MKKNNLLLTGALGHIGSYLIHNKDFLSNFKKIYLIDNISSERFVSLFSLKKKIFKFYKIDLPSIQVNNVIQHVDIVIHLAAITNAEASINLNNADRNKNFLSTKQIARLCSDFNKKLIFISSTSVYGSQKKIVNENSKGSEINPQSPYAFSKLKEEKYLISLKKKNKKFKFIILRFGTIFGYSIGMRFHTAVNKFCFQAVANIPLSVWKTAMYQSRPYLSIKDSCRIINFICDKNIFNCEIYNILTGNYTVKTILKKIKKFKKIKVNFVSSKIMNQLSFEVCNKKIQKLGFLFKGNLENDIKYFFNKVSGLK